MKTIEHIGTVVAVEGDKALVQLKADGCPAKGIACSCCSAFKAGVRTLRVKRGDLEQGDTVQVSVPAYEGYLSTLVVFVLPLALTVAGFMIGARFEEGPAHGVGTLAGGGVGFLVAVGIAMAVNRRMSSSSRYLVRRVRGQDL